MSDEGERVDGGWLVSCNQGKEGVALTLCTAPLHDFALHSGLEVLSIPNQGIKDWQVRPTLSPSISTNTPSATRHIL